MNKSLSYTQRIAQDLNAVEQYQKGFAILQAEIINSQQELSKAQATLEKLQESDQETYRFKSLLMKNERESTCRDIKCLKGRQNQHRIEIIN